MLRVYLGVKGKLDGRRFKYILFLRVFRTCAVDVCATDVSHTKSVQNIKVCKARSVNHN